MFLYEFAWEVQWKQASLGMGNWCIVGPPAFSCILNRRLGQATAVFNLIITQSEPYDSNTCCLDKVTVNNCILPLFSWVSKGFTDHHKTSAWTWANQTVSNQLSLSLYPALRAWRATAISQINEQVCEAVTISLRITDFCGWFGSGHIQVIKSPSQVLIHTDLRKALLTHSP